MQEEVSEAFPKIKSPINFKLIEERQSDRYNQYLVFEDRHDGSKQKSVSFKVYDLAIS